MECSSHCFTLSEQARSLWAKSGYSDGWLWSPLFLHMHDSWGVANKLWSKWLPPGTKDIIVRATGNNSDRARRCVCLLAALHDIGKAMPVFQTKDVLARGASGRHNFIKELTRVGLLPKNDLTDGQNVYHPIGGQVIFERYFNERYGWFPELARSYACVIGSHHGSFPLSDDLRSVSDGISTCELCDQVWKEVQDELIAHMVSYAGLDVEDFRYLGEQFMPAMVANICAGFVIMVDWIASNQDLFPLFSVTEPVPFYDSENGDYQTILEQRLEAAWKGLALVPSWQAQPCGKVSEDEFYRKRFSFPDGAKPRPIQSAALDIARNTDDLGLIIIEAPMGEGKTEAALAAAEVLAEHTGRGGVAVALPTMATTDAMFSRVNRWLKNMLPQPDQGGNAAKSIYLAHGKSQLNEEFQGIMGISERTCSAESMNQDADKHSLAEHIVVSNWMCGRKKGMLANFVVCTIDQVLMGALAMKHLGLRQLALVNKVIIIDECHAYDVYMQCYLERLLEWLGYWHTPVILLSATLPRQQRRTMTKAYCRGREASDFNLPEEDEDPSSENDDTFSYPLLSYTSGQAQLTRDVASSGRAVPISLSILSDDDKSLVDLLDASLSEGGYAGVICDTVSRAQHVASVLDQAFGGDVVKLVHARFTDFDRMQKEKELRTLLGPDPTRAHERRSKKLIVVGTQVLEQSLDIDFDLLITDIAPIDLIMQRLGRLHRHHRGDHNEGRPKNLRKARCFIRGIEKWDSTGPRFSEGIKYVYAPASLIESLAVLELCSPNASTSLTLPSDIARKVQRAYYRTDSDGEGCSEKQATMFAKANLSESSWHATYQEACKERVKREKEKKRRAKSCLLTSAWSLCDEGTLVDLCATTPRLKARNSDKNIDEDHYQRAVRDTEENVEVLLFCRYGDRICLFPWIGNEACGVERGSQIPTEMTPHDNVAKVAAQSAVRLPKKIEEDFSDTQGLISELAKRYENIRESWKDSYWLGGRAMLILDQNSADHMGAEGEEFCTKLGKWNIRYSFKCGLEVKKKVKQEYFYV